MALKILKIITLEIKLIIEFIIINYPHTPFGNWLRKIYWAKRLTIGPNFNIERGANPGNPKKITIGSNFLLGEFTQFAIGESLGVWVGNNVAIARYSWIRTANHRFDRIDIPIQQQGHESKSVSFQGEMYSVVIEDDVWVAPNVVILTGTHIGKGAVISAGSVVSGVIPPYSVVIGNPGRVMANRLKLAKLKAENGEGSNG
jgi:maltose O-acetyltransferase